MEKRRLFYNLERELKKALLEEDANGKSILEKEILASSSSDYTHSIELFQEFELESGRVDILAIVHQTDCGKDFLDIHLFELKRDQIDMDSIAQVLRYKYDILTYLEIEENLAHLSKSVEVRITCHLVGLEASCFDGDNFYLMSDLMKGNEKLIIHEYHLNHHKGQEFHSYQRYVYGDPEPSLMLKSTINKARKSILNDLRNEN